MVTRRKNEVTTEVPKCSSDIEKGTISRWGCNQCLKHSVKSDHRSGKADAVIHSREIGCARATEGPAWAFLSAPECYRAGNGPRPRAYGVPVIAALNNPLTVFVADNLPYVMGPHHDSTNRGAASA